MKSDSGTSRPQPEPCRILNTEPARLSDSAKAELNSLGEVTECAADRDYLLANAERFDVLFVALRNTLDREILERARRLRCVVTPTTGTNHIDTIAAAERRIDILSLRGETEFLQNITATAELSWGLLLALVRRLPAAHASVRQGSWNRDEFYGMELKGRTLGVLGYGRLGKMVAAYANAFRMTVLACETSAPAAPPAYVEFVDLASLLRRSDIVSIHLPLNTGTRGLFDSRCFSQMRDGSILINTARGEIVDERSLVDALASGKLAGAAVDVLADETSLDPGWLANSALHDYARTHENAIITPHIGGVTHDSVEQTNLFMIRKLAKYLADRNNIEARGTPPIS